MLYDRPIKALHLELSTRCNVACPSCMRTINPLGNSHLLNQDLSLARLKESVPEALLRQLKSVYACGNLGDPLMAPEALSIFSYLSSINPNAHYAVHTNAALRNVAYWRQLYTALGKRHRVYVGLDGLEDTNAIYRVNAVWSKAIENVKAFIDVGGIVEWVYLVFEHNQHQINEARALATTLGVDKFTLRYSHRPNTQTLTYVRGKHYNVKTDQITCKVLEKKELYVDAFGAHYPCCHIADIPFKGATNPEDERIALNPIERNHLPLNPIAKRCADICTLVTIKDHA